jgi:hypothetical protein
VSLVFDYSICGWAALCSYAASTNQWHGNRNNKPFYNFQFFDFLLAKHCCGEYTTQSSIQFL